MTMTSQAARFAPRPAITPAAPWDFPIPEVMTLDNGIEVRAFNLPGQGLVTAVLCLAASAQDDPEGLEGLADVTVGCLSEATADLDALTFAGAVEGLGATVSGRASQGISITGLSCPVSRLEDTFDLFTSTLTAPRLDPDDIERAIAMRIDALMFDRSDPGWLAQTAIEQSYHPAGSRSRLPVGGTEGSLSSITPDAVARFYEEKVGARDAVLCLAGDFTTVDLDGLLARTVGSWTGADHVGTPEARSDAQGPLVHVVDLPGSVQSQIVLAAPSVTRTDPAWAPLEVAAHILGGGTSSQLWRRLRDELGYTYGVGAEMDASRVNGRFTVHTAVEAGVTAPALVEMSEILERSRAEGFAPQHHRTAVSEITSAAPFQVETGAALASLAARAVVSGLPVDHFADNLREISASTPQSVAEAFSRSVAHDHPVIVVVGDAESIVEPLTDLDMGTPEVIDLEV